MGVGITVEHLNAFYGKTQALFDVNITVLANHATALIGPSGCGKTTFIRCLNRLHETIPEARVEGKVNIGDLSVYNGTSATQLRRRVGMVFQKPNPFPTMSIYDNVAAGLKLNGFSNRKQLDEVVENSLNSAALWDEVKDALHKQSGASLSGGQQQRLCIARALAVQPEVRVRQRSVAACQQVRAPSVDGPLPVPTGWRLPLLLAGRRRRSWQPQIQLSCPIGTLNFEPNDNHALASARAHAASTDRRLQRGPRRATQCSAANR